MKQEPSIISTAPSGEDTRTAGPVDADEGADLVEPTETRHFVVGPEQHGVRLDRALAVLVPELSRSYLQQLIEAGAVTLRGRPATKVSASVRAGEAGTVELRPTPQSQAFRPEAMDLRVVHEDAHLRVIDKPAGLVVQRVERRGNLVGIVPEIVDHRDAARLAHQIEATAQAGETRNRLCRLRQRHPRRRRRHQDR